MIAGGKSPGVGAGPRAMAGCSLAAIFALASGCGHAHTVGPAESPNEGATASSSSASDSASVKPRRTSGLKGPNGDAQNISIASSPTLLLKPGAAKRIQEKLAHDGDLHGEVDGELDGRTRDALAQFQRSHDLPATGVPDDATVRKLGLKPEDVFRSGNDQPHE